MHFWTEEEKEWLRVHYKKYTVTELLPLFNERFNVDVTKVQLAGALKRYNIKSGRDGRFVKGQKPWNKGMLGINFGGENGKKTQFKKGQRPLNYRPVGSERVNVDGYIEIKVSDKPKWRLKHNVVWEEHNGPIPKKHVVIFLDQNKLNCDINNLALISRADLLRMNRDELFSEDKESTRVGISIAKLTNKIYERERIEKD